MESPILSQTDGAKHLADCVRNGTLFAAGKLGTSELEALCFYMTNRNPPIKTQYPTRVIKNMTVNAGLFPATEEALDAWSNHMLKKVLPSIDIVVEWSMLKQENQILTMANPESTRIRLRSLEPYYESQIKDRWTAALPSSAIVAVISPFSKTIKRQWEMRTEVWLINTIWPADITIVPIQCGYAPTLTNEPQTSWPQDILTKGWVSAVVSIVQQAKTAKATHAVIGCGALSLPIAAALKQQGITAIHTGGATQILFGIKGRRWDTHAIISTLYNDAWIYPHTDEIPPNANKVENGCYW